jgi:hypothetical protein
VVVWIDRERGQFDRAQTRVDRREAQFSFKTLPFLPTPPTVQRHRTLRSPAVGNEQTHESLLAGLVIVPWTLFLEESPSASGLERGDPFNLEIDPQLAMMLETDRCRLMPPIATD